MFFIFGISSKVEKLAFLQTTICHACGKFGRYDVYMAYTCLSLFFIPTLKWGKKYYVQTSCCHRIYSIDKALGQRIQKGEAIQLTENDFIYEGNGSNFKTAYCPNCGAPLEEEFDFCPKCGQKR